MQNGNMLKILIFRYLIIFVFFFGYIYPSKASDTLALMHDYSEENTFIKHKSFSESTTSDQRNIYNSSENSLSKPQNTDPFTTYVERSLVFYNSRQRDSAAYYINLAHQNRHNTNRKTASFADYLFISGSLYARTNIPIAKKFLVESLHCRLAIDSLNSDILFRTYNNLGVISNLEQNYREALSYYFHANDISTHYNLSINPSSLFYLQENIGICYKKLNNDDSARVYLKKVIRMGSTLKEEHSNSIANAYINLGWIETNNEKYALAAKYYDSAQYMLSITVEPNTEHQFLLYQNYGTNCLLTGKLQKAEQYFNLALSKATGSSRQSYKTEEVRLNLANIYLSTQDFEKAISQYRMILSSKDKALRLKAIRNIARTFEKMDRTDSASYYHEQIINKTIEGNYTSHESALNHLYYGYFLVKNNLKLDQAIAELQKAANYFIQNKDTISRDLAECYINMGIYYTNQNNDIKGISHLFMSLNILQNAQKNYDLEINKSENDSKAIRVYYHLGSIYLKKYFIQKNDSLLLLSHSYLKRAIELLENFRYSLSSDETKMNITARARSIYNKEVLCLLELNKLFKENDYLNEAFIMAEKSKASTLLEAIRQNEIKNQLKQMDTLLRLENTLKIQASALQQKLNIEKEKTIADSSLIQEYIEKLYGLTDKADSINETIISAVKENQINTTTDILHPDSILGKMDSTSCLLEYVLSDSLMHTFIFADNMLYVESQLIDSNFTQHLTNFRQKTIRFPGQDALNELNSFNESAYYLYKKLIPDKISENPNIKKIIIIPDEDLAYLAFDALSKTNPEDKPGSFRLLHYMIRDYNIGYDYLASLHFKNIRNSTKKEANKGIIAMAPEYPTKKESGLVEFNHLKWVKAEVDSIGDLFDADIFTGKHATKSNFLNKASDYAILHFAMHAVADEDNPLNSHLVFYNGDTSLDFRLHVYEIYHQILSAKLAVLSSCNTGFGKLEKGEGIISLARSFAYAGIPSTIMALWEIEDKPGFQVIISFYNNLRQGYPSDEALRTAKLNFLNSANNLLAHPYFWAAYVPVGEPVKFDKQLFIKTQYNYILHYILTGILFLIVAFLILRYRRKAKR